MNAGKEPNGERAVARVDAYLASARALFLGKGDPYEPLLQHDVESPLVLEELRRHHLSALLGMNTSEERLALLPQALGTAIRERARDRKQRLHALLCMFDDFDASLRQNGIPYLLFKGFHLGDRFYGGAARRPQFDLDVLIPPGDLKRAVRDLRRRGFSRVARDEHSVTYRRGRGEIDLHWKLRNTPAYRLDSDAIWRDKVPYTFGARRFFTLSDEYTVALLALSIVHDLERGCCKIKQLLDLYLVLRQVDAELDWSGFVVRRRRENLVSLCLTGLAVTLSAFECQSEVPRLQALLERERAQVGVTGRSEVLFLLSRAQGDIDAKVWFLNIYPGSALHYRSWLVYRQFPGILLRVRPSWFLKVPKLALGIARRAGGKLG